MNARLRELLDGISDSEAGADPLGAEIEEIEADRDRLIEEVAVLRAELAERDAQIADLASAIAEMSRDR